LLTNLWHFCVAARTASQRLRGDRGVVSRMARPRYQISYIRLPSCCIICVAARAASQRLRGDRGCFADGSTTVSNELYKAALMFYYLCGGTRFEPAAQRLRGLFRWWLDHGVKWAIMHNALMLYYLCSGTRGEPAAERRGGQSDHAVRQRDVVPLEQHQHGLPAEDHWGNHLQHTYSVAVTSVQDRIKSKIVEPLLLTWVMIQQ
jgi:hypothetical protein